MLSFLVFEDGKPAQNMLLRNAHLLGVDDVGVRGEVRFEEGKIQVEKSTGGTAGLALQYEVPGIGDLMLQTCLLPDRDEPYILTLELARHRLMRILSKQEDWAMFEIPAEAPARERFAYAKDKFIDALSALGNPAKVDALATEALAAAIDASEGVALCHANVLMQRRTGMSPSRGGISKYAIGCGVASSQTHDKFGNALGNCVDYVCVPCGWRQVEPQEQQYRWSAVDHWCEWLVKRRMPVIAGPLISFAKEHVPDWLYVWEHDYDTIRDLLYEHIETMVGRYKNVVSLWNVASGLHVNSHFKFSFEHIMDLTRMGVMLTKKTNPNARTLIEIIQPFGEYYAQNQRSIPPIMYAEMITQAGIPFDAYGLRILLGNASEGQWMRDLMQVSAVLDRFNGLGKPLHITAAAVPSQAIHHDPDATRSDDGWTGDSGNWRGDWSPQVQADWLEQLYQVVLSKPYVESMAWLDIADHNESELPGAGLMDQDRHPKPALRKLASLHKQLHEHETEKAG